MTPEMLHQFMSELASVRELNYVVIFLVLVITLERLIALGTAIKRMLGLRHDPMNGSLYSPLTLGQFKVTAQTCVDNLKSNLDRRFNAVDEQLKISRRKDNIMLIILRDIHAWMIYAKKPARNLPPIEVEDEGEVL